MSLSSSLRLLVARTALVHPASVHHQPRLLLHCSSSRVLRSPDDKEKGDDGGKSKAEDGGNFMKGMTPIGKLEEFPEGQHPYQEKEPLKPHPGGVNPETGEVGGPAGPEPTRYGDWERKGRVTDF